MFVFLDIKQHFNWGNNKIAVSATLGVGMYLLHRLFRIVFSDGVAIQNVGDVASVGTCTLFIHF